MAQKARKNTPKPKQVMADPARERLQKQIALIAGLFVLAIFSVHPLMITNQYWNITYTKLATFVTLLCAALGSAAFAAVYYWAGRDKRVAKGRKPQPFSMNELAKRVRPYEWALLAYWLVILISAVTSVEQMSVWKGTSLRSEGFWMQTAYLLTIVFVGRFYRFKERDLLVLCGVATVISVYAIFQYFGMDFLGLNVEGGLHDYNPNDYGPQLTFLSTMSNRNMFAPYLCIAFLVSAVMFSQMKKRMHWAYLPCAAITFFTLLLNNTDSGYIGIIASVLVFFPFVARDRKSAGRVLFVGSGMALLVWLFDFCFSIMCDFGPSHMASFAPIMPFAALALAAAGACFYFVNIEKLPAIKPVTWRVAWACVLVVIIVGGYLALPFVAEKTGDTLIVEANRLIRGGELSDEMGSGRGFIWTRAVKLVPLRPVFGHGPDTFSPVFFDYFIKDSLEYANLVFDKAHSEYIQTLVDEGIAGLLCMLAFYALVFWQARKRLDETAPLALCAAMLCIIVQAIFNFSTPITHPIIYTMWGILAGLTLGGRFLHATEGAKEEKSRA